MTMSTETFTGTAPVFTDDHDHGRRAAEAAVGRAFAAAETHYREHSWTVEGVEVSLAVTPAGGDVTGRCTATLTARRTNDGEGRPVLTTSPAARHERRAARRAAKRIRREWSKYDAAVLREGYYESLGLGHPEWIIPPADPRPADMVEPLDSRDAQARRAAAQIRSAS